MGLTAFNRLRREEAAKAAKAKAEAEAKTAAVAAEESRTGQTVSPVPAEDKAPAETAAEVTKTTEPEAEEHKSKPGRKKTVKEEADSEKADLF